LARALIVGCGCRGRGLARELSQRGHAVRGTSRSPEGAGAIEHAGVEAVVADPDRLGTILPALEGVSAVGWLLGSASGPTAAAVNGPRLEAMLERLVDTPVRGFVLEAAGPASTAIARRAGETWRMPVEVVEEDPADHVAWTAAMAAAVERVLS
jgi:uncharacterized protein YbjT (DUF2867 family)